MIGRGQAVQLQEGAESREWSGQGKGFGVALREGVGLTCGTPATKVDSHWSTTLLSDHYTSLVTYPPSSPQVGTVHSESSSADVVPRSHFHVHYLVIAEHYLPIPTSAFYTTDRPTFSPLSQSHFCVLAVLEQNLLLH